MWMSLNFGQIAQLTTELAVLEHLKKSDNGHEHSSAFILD